MTGKTVVLVTLPTKTRTTLTKIKTYSLYSTRNKNVSIAENDRIYLHKSNHT